MSAPVVVSKIQNRRGTQEQFNALYPPGYNGSGGFNVIPEYTPEAYPNVLLPGELALCVNTRRLFIGNVNGEYFELTQPGTTDGIPPLVLFLNPTDEFTVIPELTHPATPFFNILYSLADSLVLDPNVPGQTFSVNGYLQITTVEGGV